MVLNCFSKIANDWFLAGNVTCIGEAAFLDCSSLASITIPKSVSSIDLNAFSGCSKLTINCEVSSKPSGWHTDWNPDNRPVVWTENTAVAESSASAVNIYAYGKTIVVENATDEIRVFNAMGTLVCRDVARNVSTVAESGIRVELQVNDTGVYIVKVGNVAKRVVVK